MDISAIDPVSKLERTARILVAGLILWALPGLGLQANDDYLSILEAEAGDTDARAGMSAAPVSHEPPAKKHYAKKSDVIRSGLDFEGFEEELDSNYSGSHLLYVKLSSSNRQRVYKSYKEDNRISAMQKNWCSGVTAPGADSHRARSRACWDMAFRQKRFPTTMVACRCGRSSD
jgi:hypothetical protein